MPVFLSKARYIVFSGGNLFSSKPISFKLPADNSCLISAFLAVKIGVERRSLFDNSFL